MSETTATTPRAVRHRLNKMEAWLTKNRHRLTVQRQDAAEHLLDAVTAEHADALGEALKAWLAEGDRLAQRIEEVAHA